MAKIIIIAGYTKKDYLTKIRSYFKNTDIILACAYTRLPNSEVKEGYLALFDSRYDLTNPSDRERLKQDAPGVLLVTCTQERDMMAYIDAQLISGKITDEQAHNYKLLIDKEFFKKSVQKVYPQLVPNLHVVTPELLTKLDTLTYPLVIKPTGLTGSTLIKIVTTPEEFKSHYETFSELMIRLGNNVYKKQINIIAETYIAGPQYSINVYVNKAAEITFCPTIRVVTPQELGINDTYSALQYTTNELTSSELDELKQAIKKLVLHFKVKNTSMHFDCVLNNGQWMFFEVGLRIGGNRQKLFELSHGMDHFLNDVINRSGEKVVIPEQKKTACIVQKAAVVHGTLQKISYERVITAEQKVLVAEDKVSSVGKVTGPVSTGGGTIIRHFVSGKDQAQVVAVSTQLFTSIAFELN